MKSILICSLALLLPAITVQAWDILWIYQFGSGIVTGSIAGGKTDATGVYTAGSTFPALPGQKLVGGSTDAYVRKFSFAGTVLWTREFGTQGFDIETALTMGRDGLYVAGRTSGAFPGYSNAGSYYAFVRKYDPTGNVLWTTQLETLGLNIIFSDAMTQRNGALYIAGSADGTFPGPPGQGVDIYCKACSCRFPSERMKNFSEWRTHEDRELPA